MPTLDERYYIRQRLLADRKRRDQSTRQSLIDARYAARAEAVIEADVALMLADEREAGDGDDGGTSVETR